VASIARRRADDVALLEQQAAVLRVYGRDVAGADYPKAIVSVTASALEALFHVPVIVLLVSETAVQVVERRGRIAPVDAEMEAAKYSLTVARPVPAAVYPFDASRFDFWPVATFAGPRAVIGLAFDPDERPSKPGTLVDTVGSLLALALDRQQARAGLTARPAG
jgi:two-component system sensor histidine kinase KdpD